MGEGVNLESIVKGLGGEMRDARFDLKIDY